MQSSRNKDKTWREHCREQDLQGDKDIYIYTLHICYYRRLDIDRGMRDIYAYI